MNTIEQNKSQQQEHRWECTGQPFRGREKKEHMVHCIRYKAITKLNNKYMIETLTDECKRYATFSLSPEFRNSPAVAVEFCFLNDTWVITDISIIKIIYLYPDCDAHWSARLSSGCVLSFYSKFWVTLWSHSWKWDMPWIILTGLVKYIYLWGRDKLFLPQKM